MTDRYRSSTRARASRAILRDSAARLALAGILDHVPAGHSIVHDQGGTDVATLHPQGLHDWPKTIRVAVVLTQPSPSSPSADGNERGGSATTCQSSIRSYCRLVHQRVSTSYLNRLLAGMQATGGRSGVLLVASSAHRTACATEWHSRPYRSGPCLRLHPPGRNRAYPSRAPPIPLLTSCFAPPIPLLKRLLHGNALSRRRGVSRFKNPTTTKKAHLSGKPTGHVPTFFAGDDPAGALHGSSPS